MSLTAIVFAALTSLVRQSTYWTPVPPSRVVIIADDIALAAALHDGAPFTGPDRVTKHALALAAIAVHESNLASKVVSCRYDGDPLQGWKPGRGRSITHFQLMRGAAWFGHTKEEICTSGPLAAYLAGSVLRNHARTGTALGVFRGYASGDSSRPVKAADRQCRMWTKIATNAGLKVSCWARP
jgi:hypothetical protein